jgi:hypothetical protein
MIRKIDLVNRAYSKLRISGLTVSASPEEVTAALNRLDDFVLGIQWNIGYIQPEVYGESDSNDDSGLTNDIVNAVTTLLAEQLAPDFGEKKISIVSSQLFQKMVSDANQTLSRKFVEIEGAKFPTGLPIGIANEYPNNLNRSFFYEGDSPSENDGGYFNADNAD